MIYLIAHLSGWLLLTALFAALAGWVYAAHRAAPAEAAARRERNKLMRDLINIGVETNAPANGVSDELERQMDILRRRAELDASRVAELERSLEAARASATEAQGHAAELQRALDRTDGQPSAPAAAPLPAAEVTPIDVEAQPAPEDDSALQIWRLRYFEQRVRYLEGARTAAAAAPVALAAPVEAAPEPQQPLPEWRARMAEAQVTHLEQALRDAQTPAAPVEALAPVEAASPFASDSHIDVLLRWRLLYLERRVGYLQEAQDQQPAAPEPVAAPTDDAAPDPDRWKWRARYLEARVRHLEGRLEDASTPAPQPAPVVSEPTPAAPQPVLQAPPPAAPPAPSLVPSGVRPPSIPAARNGAPDDLTLIDGVSSLQQSSLNSLGVFHFDQIAAWTPGNVAWVDQYLRLRGRIEEEEWLEQADDLAREGPEAARVHEDETA